MKKHILSIYPLIFAVLFLISCNAEKKEIPTTEKDWDQVIHLSDLYSEEQIDQYFTEVKSDFKKFVEDDGIITYELQQEQIANKSVLGLYNKTTAFPLDVEENLFMGFVMDQTVELLDSKELDYTKVENITINSTNYVTYEVFSDNRKFGYFILFHKKNKMFSVNLFALPFIEPDFERLNKKIDDMEKSINR
ncbi:hypothetical protein Q4603_08960 [Zobellia galactanivorans]|uniref:Hypothetical lipoprotein n=1 Tax=Zobellia galactanivorans (strain DSM 12802 / CCUG 47099 / CIP 106680 / NCIMB 13871 / Dsij) TaxID=63186 RepID=G0L326_ZOBGA|nr:MULTISPECIES: hypothetical protein [Zobellia]MBU3024965.1 hypothetical protein [Zobellia galactanivorans]MDO6808739.1 hypothetical protein [Zobellia galactanivorans]OWW25714.1 hypothetical protein B4Q04_08920 [Zobellia sp. OII3]CAZ98345.1 Hypothetical lipoprotein [Zobellia galactanivorans]